jgi:hypothetical protein
VGHPAQDGVMVCVRRAWLDLYGDGALVVPLEDSSAGYFCTSLDLGAPAVREVTNPRAAADGNIDRTAFMGPRAVSAAITALAGAGATIDAVPSLFAPFQVPRARPELHYVLDRPGTPERVLVLRPAGISSPIEGPFQRDIQLQFVAPDPVIRDPLLQTATALAGSDGAGRTYDLTYFRLYPVGGSSPTIPQFTSAGDIPVAPRLLIYGPVTAPVASLQAILPSGQSVQGDVAFDANFSINAGDYVDVDCRLHTALLNSVPGQSVIDRLQFSQTVWPLVYPLPYTNYLALTGSTTSGISQLQCVWQDGFIE